MRICTRISLILLSLLVFGGLSSCRGSGASVQQLQTLTPQTHAQTLLINLAVLNPRLAEPLVKGFSAAAMDRAVSLVVATGVEESRWAEGLLRRTWWLPGDLEASTHQPDRVEEVLSEVRKAGARGGQDGERLQKEARDAITGESKGVPRDSVGGSPGEVSGRGVPAPGIPFPSDPEDEAHQRREELEDAVRWVQYTQAWSSYYEAASRGGAPPAWASEGALDQAVTMSLLRPDFLDRLAALLAEGLGS